ncbi:MAG: GNAT family N-acetyltransferase, partial [Rhodobacteraceae bacterium]|nr:GNAT family N-acetyltransferase [Paracoccaceae bacterium]
DTNRRLAWRAFGHAVGHWVLKDYGPFIMTDKTNGRPIGWVGPWCPEGWPEPEIAWSIWSDEHEGKGLAFEGALAARNWGYNNTDIQSFVSYVDHGNTPSSALARRLGCKIDDTADRFEGEELDYDVWRHPAADSDGNPEAYA